MQSLTLEPTLENIAQATAFVEEILEQNNCPINYIFKMGVVIDDWFANIVHYSGASEVTLECGLEEQVIWLRFSDNGRPYDPTKQPPPDLSLSAEEREIGGLGIFLVKSMTDSLEYEYLNGRNILTLKKQFA